MKIAKTIIVILLSILIIPIAQAQQSEFQGSWIGEKNDWVDRSANRLEISGNNWSHFFNGDKRAAGTIRFTAGRAELLLANGNTYFDLSLLAPGLIEQPVTWSSGLYRFRRIEILPTAPQQDAKNYLNIDAQEEYTILYTGKDDMQGKDFSGFVIIRKEINGKIVIIPKFSENTPRIELDNMICPLLLEKYYVSGYTRDIVIEKNTKTITNLNGSSEKTTIDGNLTTRTWTEGFSEWPYDYNYNSIKLKSSGWEKTILNENSIITTKSDGSWIRKNTISNQTMITYSDGNWLRITKDENIVTRISSWGIMERIVSEGNIESVYLNNSDKVAAKKIVNGNIETIILNDRICREKIDVGNTITIIQSGLLTLKVEKNGYNIFINYVYTYAGDNSLDIGDNWYSNLYL